MLIINNDGILTEYLLSVSSAPYHGVSGVFPPGVQQRSNPDETHIQCTPTPIAQWTLHRYFTVHLILMFEICCQYLCFSFSLFRPNFRNKISADFRAPICEQNPLWMWFNPNDVCEEKIEEVDAKWITQVQLNHC